MCSKLSTLLLLAFFTAATSLLTVVPHRRFSRAACHTSPADETESLRNKKTSRLGQTITDSAPGAVDPARREVLSCRIKGFYPFPEMMAQSSGLGSVVYKFQRWLFKDTHQAILVCTCC